MMDPSVGVEFQGEGKCVEQPSSKYLLTPTGVSGARAPAEYQEKGRQLQHAEATVKETNAQLQHMQLTAMLGKLESSVVWLQQPVQAARML